MTDCAYGTEPKPAAPIYVYATPTDLASWLGYVSDWLADQIQRTATIVAATSELCASLPPALPTMAVADWLDPLKVSAYITAFALNRLWYDNCRCKNSPGSGGG